MRCNTKRLCTPLLQVLFDLRTSLGLAAANYDADTGGRITLCQCKYKTH